MKPEIRSMYLRCGLDHDRERPLNSVRRSGSTTRTLMHLLIALEKGDEVMFVDHYPARAAHRGMLHDYAAKAGIDVSGVKYITHSMHDREVLQMREYAFPGRRVFHDHYRVF